MDCDHARQWLVFARPTELEAADLARLDGHLATCPECGPLARANRGADEAIARAMQAIAIPDGLRDRLATQLDSARTTWLRMTALRASAACVAALLTISLIHSVTRPSLDLTTEAEKTTRQPGLWKPPGRGLEDANDSLRALGAPALAPIDFDYRMLKFVERSDSFGVRSAPTLVFTRPDDAYAKVVIVSESQIKNLPQLADQTGEASGCWITVKPVPERSGWYYIITTYGKPLQFFQQKGAGTAA